MGAGDGLHLPAIGKGVQGQQQGMSSGVPQARTQREMRNQTSLLFFIWCSPEELFLWSLYQKK